MYLIYSSIKHYFRSIKLHGVHSPFVYELVTRCFYDKTLYPEYKVMDTYRKALRKDTRKIEVTDYGSGSRVFKSTTRSVSAIAKHAGINKRKQYLLFRLARYLDFRNTLELGTSLGMGSAALGLHKNNRVVTVEGCPATSGMAQEYFDTFGFENITLVRDTFARFLKQALPYPPDCVYFDGHHDQKHTLENFYRLLPRVQNNTLFIFDDIYWSKGMTSAWKEIAAHPEVSVSIDTFWQGLVFFRKEQPKEHFNIRL
jgi:predicted O-methyltransferase YrrM